MCLIWGKVYCIIISRLYQDKQQIAKFQIFIAIAFIRFKTHDIYYGKLSVKMNRNVFLQNYNSTLEKNIFFVSIIVIVSIEEHVLIVESVSENG